MFKPLSSGPVSCRFSGAQLQGNASMRSGVAASSYAGLRAKRRATYSSDKIICIDGHGSEPAGFPLTVAFVVFGEHDCCRTLDL